MKLFRYLMLAAMVALSISACTTDEPIDDINNSEERELAKEILGLDTSNPKYLKDINLHLNEAVPGMDLFVWASSWTTLHITDLNQNLDFKNILKKKGLI